jgi:arsenate reductase
MAASLSARKNFGKPARPTRVEIAWRFPYSQASPKLPGARNGRHGKPGHPTMDVIIYHNPACATSRNVLALIRNSGVEPHIIDYQKCPPTRLLLAQLIARADLKVRELLRQKGTPYKELGLDDSTLSDDALLDAMIAHPILIERPLVVTPNGVRLSRPSERVIDLLPPQRGEFFKEDGMRIVDEKGRRVATA